MSTITKRLLIGGLLALVAALPFNTMAGEALSRVVDFKVLKVGMSGGQPPMNTVNRDGELMGMDVDLARAQRDMARASVLSAGDHPGANRNGLVCGSLHGFRKIDSYQE